MGKRIRNSLTTKVFLFTMILLTVCCIATYAILSWLIPQTYTNLIDFTYIEAFAEQIIEEFRHTNSKDLKCLAIAIEETVHTNFDQELELHIFNQSGKEIYGNQEEIKDITDYVTTRHTAIMSFFLIDQNEEYQFFFLDGSQAINQALLAMNQAFPYLLIMVFMIAILAAYFYSMFITSPILKINRISEKMINLDFSFSDISSRTDELGVLHNNLSSLTMRLSMALNELKRANRQLEQDINQEKELEKKRTELFSAISHELKTPITIAKGQLEGMICKIGRYKDRDIYLVKTLEALNGLELMVQELLVAARIDTPGYIIQKERFDLSSLIRDSLMEKEDLFLQKNMYVDCNLSSGIVYCGDWKLLKKVFDNLLVNANSHSPENQQIKVSVNEEKGYIQFSIENTGVHLDKEELPLLFDAFYRSDQSRNRQTGGNGLGLYIVKRILDLHNAYYCLNNSKKGVVFLIRFFV